MARKKYFDENNEEQEGQGQTQQSQQTQYTKGQGGVKSFAGSVGGGLLLGGGTKNRNKSQDYRYANNADESDASITKQLSTLGLAIREMPGDGNCLFRALSDQIAGSSRNHLEYRRSVVQYMKDFRADFEPFVEDDVPFDKYVQRLSQAGTFAGNDAIVAFARLHNVSVVIHQLNSPAWIIHPSKETHEHPSGREVHIFYHNGDHYNSVRRVGDDSESPTNFQNVRLHAQTNASSKSGFNKSSGKKSPPHTTSSLGMKSSTSTTNPYNSVDYDSYGGARDEDYWVKDTSDLDRLVDEIMQQTNYPDPTLVRETLLDYNFDMLATTDFILSMSVMMNQHQCPQKNVNQEIGLDEGKQEPENSLERGLNMSEPESGSTKTVLQSPSKKVVTDMDEQVEDSEDSGMPDDPDESSSSPHSEVCSSQENEETRKEKVHKEPRLSGRQKKEQKKRERKREADLRRKRNAGAGGGSEVDVPENTVVISNLGSLDI